MRIVLFDDWRLGLLEDGLVFDVTGALDGREATPLFMQGVAADFDRLAPRLRAAAGRARGRPLGELRLRPPLPHPSKILAAKANYRRHAQEMAARRGGPPAEPDFFLKAPSAVTGPGETVRLPPGDGVTEHEAELAVVMKGPVRGIHADAALDAVLGYTGLIDVSLRSGDGDLSRKKSYDTFAPLGPCLVTADEVPDPHRLGIRLWVNGELRQDGTTADLVLSVPQLVELAASVMTLYPGDIIATGTPEGVGVLRDGDRVAMEIDRIGRLEVMVKQG